MDQISFPTVYMRGGTSRALFFNREALPADRADWDAILAAALGTPDPHGRQLDGMGGGISSLSKAAVIGPATRPDADIDYTFAQVPIDTAVVQYKGNCGNISAAVGPYAVDEGLVSVQGDNAAVRIHNTNTGKIIVARFPLAGGKAAVDGEFTLQGVAGSGAPVRLSFIDPGGAATGHLFPTGRRRDTLDIAGLGPLEVSLIDAANPVVMLHAASLGLRGDETPASLRADPRLMATCEQVRRTAAVAMGLAANMQEATDRLRSLPLVAVLSDPGQEGCHIRVRMFSSGQPHLATPLTGGMCVAAAMHIEGTIANTTGRRPEGDDVVLEHPSGTLRVGAHVLTQRGSVKVAETAVYRTARRLMEGRVYVPTRRLR